MGQFECIQCDPVTVKQPKYIGLSLCLEGRQMKTRGKAKSKRKRKVQLAKIDLANGVASCDQPPLGNAKGGDRREREEREERERERQDKERQTMSPTTSEPESSGTASDASDATALVPPVI